MVDAGTPRSGSRPGAVPEPRSSEGPDENEDVAVPRASYGAAEPVAGGSDAAADPFLYLPDPESRSGWALHRVRRNARSNRPIGFTR